MFRLWFRPFDWDPWDVWGDPFREIRALSRMMDRWSELPAYTTARAFVRPDFELDVTERPEEFVVKAVLPGLSPEHIDINIVQDVLTISAEWPEVKEEGIRYLVRERAGGRRERRLRLPMPVKTDEIEARYENGILTVVVPKAEEVRPRKIVVQGAAPQLTGKNQEDVIEGEARVVED